MQKVRFDSVSGDGTMFGLYNARPHEIDMDASSQFGTKHNGSKSIPQAHEVISAIADPSNNTGLQALDRGSGGSSGRVDVLEVPINGVCHKDAWFLELFPHELVHPLRAELGMDLPGDEGGPIPGVSPCVERDLGLNISEQMQILIHNVMHLALEMPDDVFPKARWLKPSRSYAETGPNADPWSEVMAFDLHWLTNDPRISFSEMSPLKQEASTGRPYRINRTTFERALCQMPDMFSLCRHILQTYLARPKSVEWFKLMQSKHFDGDADLKTKFDIRLHMQERCNRVLNACTNALHSEIRALGPKLRGSNHVQIPFSPRLSDSLQVYRSAANAALGNKKTAKTRTKSKAVTAAAAAIGGTVAPTTPVAIVAGQRKKRMRSTSMMRVDATFVLPTAVCVLMIQHTVHRPGQAPVLLLDVGNCPGGNRDRLFTACVSILSTTVTLSNVPACAKRMVSAVHKSLGGTQKARRMDGYFDVDTLMNMDSGRVPAVYRTPDFVERAVCSVVVNSRHSKDSDRHMVSYKRVPGVHDFLFGSKRSGAQQVWPSDEFIENHGSGNKSVYDSRDTRMWNEYYIMRAINVDLCENDRISAMHGGLDSSRLAPVYSVQSSTGDSRVRWCGTFSRSVYLAAMCGQMRRKRLPDGEGMHYGFCTLSEARSLLAACTVMNRNAMGPELRVFSSSDQKVHHLGLAAPEVARLWSSTERRAKMVELLLQRGHKLYSDRGFSGDPFGLVAESDNNEIDPDKVKCAWDDVDAVWNKVILPGVMQLRGPVVGVGLPYMDEMRMQNGKGYHVVRVAVNCLSSVRKTMRQDGSWYAFTEQMHSLPESFAQDNPALAMCVPVILHTMSSDPRMGEEGKRIVEGISQLPAIMRCYDVIREHGEASLRKRTKVVSMAELIAAHRKRYSGYPDVCSDDIMGRLCEDMMVSLAGRDACSPINTIASCLVEHMGQETGTSRTGCFDVFAVSRFHEWVSRACHGAGAQPTSTAAQKLSHRVRTRCKEILDETDPAWGAMHISLPPSPHANGNVFGSGVEIDLDFDFPLPPVNQK